MMPAVTQGIASHPGIPVMEDPRPKLRMRLAWIVLAAAALHVAGVARSDLPAQDGLKFLKVAQRFQREPFLDVVRGSDQHPLYPLVVALAEPAVSGVLGPGPDSRRIAAQGVSVAASLLSLVLLAVLAGRLFGREAALVTALLGALLPEPARLGREALADPLALCGFVAALVAGEQALRRRSPRAAALCGALGGIAYWARPEVIVVPLALVPALAWTGLAAWRAGRFPSTGWMSSVRPNAAPACAAMAVLVVGVGLYAAAKGEVSEKLSIRGMTGDGPRAALPQRAAPHLPQALREGGWDFAPKEEPDTPRITGTLAALIALGRAWAEGIGWLLVLPACWGLLRVPAGPGKAIVACCAAAILLAVTRHAAAFGYLSDRHAMTLVYLSLPWAAAGALDLGRRAAAWFGWGPGRRVRIRYYALVVLVVACVGAQMRPAHASREGHRQAGLWLARAAGPGQAVLDTRGWAAFIWDGPAYDAWHIGQALTDARLAYIVVGEDELAASSRRAATLRALLAHTGRLAARFDGRPDGTGHGVRIYHFERPASWEGMGT
jgi:hypothetical protein